MRYLKIPLDRVGVLIGPQGDTKKYIEEHTHVSLDIDSEVGEICIDDHASEDPLMIFKVEHMVRAIGRGFSPEHAFRLFSDEVDFYLFDIHEYVGKKPSHVKRLKSRVIGSEGKTKRVLEELTQANISVYGHTIAVIADIFFMDIVKKAIDMLLSGSKHATVYRYVERSMKQLRR